MRRLLAIAGTAIITAALVIARRRAAKGPWAAAEAKYMRGRIDGLDVADPGAAYETMFRSLIEPRDT